MSEFLFPDTTVLCNFAAVQRLELLRSVLGERGRWTQAIEYEVGRSAGTFPALARVAGSGWLGEPIEVTDEAEIQQIQAIRRVVFGGDSDHPLKHLGEAETCYVIGRWPEFAGSWWISDDREALRYARGRGITTRETCDLVAIAVADGDVTAAEGMELLRAMVRCGRHLRLPAGAAELSR